MRLTKRKGLLVLLLFVATSLLTVYSFLLNRKTVDVPLREGVLRLEAGRLVARSQFDFHHMVEQWVPPGRLKNHSIRRKERLIEDGRVIQEAFEYGESDKERVDEGAHREQKPDAGKAHVQSSRDGSDMDTQAKDSKPAVRSNVPALFYKNSAAMGNQKEPSEQKMKLDLSKSQVPDEFKYKSRVEGSPPQQVHMGSSHESEGGASDTRTRHRALLKKPSLALDNQPSESRTNPVLTYHQEWASVKSESELKAAPELSDGPDSSNLNAQLGVEPARHKQRSLLQEGVYVPDSVEARAQMVPERTDQKKYGQLPSEWKAELAFANQLPKREHLKAEFAALDKRVESVNSKVKKVVRSGNGSQLHAAHRRPNPSDSKQQVATANSHARIIRVLKDVDDSSINSGSEHGIVKRVSDTQAKLNLAPPLVLNASSYNSDKYSHSGRLEDVDFETDPRYAHLPPAVKKKLAAIRKNRLERIEFVREIRKRCEGKKYCLPHVSSNERNLHDGCFYNVIKKEAQGIELNPCQCSLMTTTSSRVVNYYGKAIVNAKRPLVALVSLPGSGNTWVRGLLEQATGYCTGSMWCDPILRAKQFCGEGIRTNTLVVKNHDPEIRWDKEKLVNSSGFIKPSFSSAIFVHRDPYAANIAEWNRALGYKVYNATKHNLTVAGIGYYNASAVKNQHTVAFGKEAFGLNPGWNWTIYKQMENWEAMIYHLLVNVSENHPVLLVKYEDLKRDSYGEVERMLSFLDVKFKDDYLREKLKNGFHAFHRNHTYTFDHYTMEQKVYMNQVINRVSKLLQHHNIDYLPLQKYLRD